MEDNKLRIKINTDKVNSSGFTINEKVNVTDREIEILVLTGLGLDNETIAKRYGVEKNTVTKHMWNLMQKVGAASRTHALALAVQNGIITITGPRKITGKKQRKYLLCIVCKKASLSSDYNPTEPNSIKVNQAEYSSPCPAQCPYNDCKGDINTTIEWDFVRMRRPEYPAIPEKGKEYEIGLDWI